MSTPITPTATGSAVLRPEDVFSPDDLIQVGTGVMTRSSVQWHADNGYGIFFENLLLPPIIEPDPVTM